MTTPNQKGSGRGQGAALKWMQWEDAMRQYVRIQGLKQLGYCWGGHTATGIDTPDTLYVKIDNDDYEVPASIVTLWQKPTVTTAVDDRRVDGPAAAS